MKRIEFVCSLPEVKGLLGGETLKNKYIYKYLKKNSVEFNLLDFERYKHIKILLLLKCLWSIINPSSKKILLSKASKSSYYYIRLINIFNFLKKDVYYMVVGGTFHNFLKEGMFETKYYKVLKRIYVESIKMKEELERLGLNNVEYLPNFKEFKIRGYREKEIGKPLRCVFFSRIVPEKGIEMIFEALKDINGQSREVNVDFYGPISEEYEGRFYENLEGEDAASYGGVLNIQDDKTYDTLNEYDLMLFPTYWEGEGFPGTLIDSFIAGLPVLASDWNYNTEVLDERTGYIFKAKDQENFLNKLKDIIGNKDLLKEKSLGCLEKSRRYHVDNVLKELRGELLEERC